MTTITGCLSQLYFDQATGETTYVNGNVNTPMAPLPGYGAHDLATGRGVAVPGWWGGFEAAHDRHASLPRKDLMADAIAYARDGFEMHPFLWGEVFIQSEKIGRTAAGREIFFDGHAIPRRPARRSTRSRPRTPWSGSPRRGTTTSTGGTSRRRSARSSRRRAAS